MNLLGSNSMRWSVCSLSTWGACPLSAQGLISTGGEKSNVTCSGLAQASCMLGAILGGGKQVEINEPNQIGGRFSDRCKLKGCVNQLVSLFMNKDYSKADRRSLSIIQPPFVQDLDPMAGQPNPLGCMGSYARLTAENVEAFVNIGTIISKLRSRPLAGNLLTLMEVAETNNLAYQAIRIAIRDAIRTIGAKAYEYEWTDNVTYMNIDTLLEGLAAYKDSNQIIAEQLTEKLKKGLAASNEIVILDLGSGVGGTSMELLRHMDGLMQSEGGIRSVQGKIKLILYDVSQKQLEIAKSTLQNQFGLNEIITVEGGFNEIGIRLSRCVGMLDIVVSGAAICHVINKEQFFNELHDLMAMEGVLSFWDPAFPIYQADYVRLSNGDEHYVEYRTTDGEVYRVKKGELLDVDVIRKLENRNYTTHTTVDADGMALFITALVHMYMGQMGYSSDNMDEQNVRQLKNKLASDVMKDAASEPGFNLVEWYRHNLADHAVYSELPKSARTPYDLIEAVSDEDAYERTLRSSGFTSYRVSRVMEPQLSSDNNSVQSIFAYFYAEKSG